MKMFLISDNIDTYTGMRLAGVEGVVVHEREELKKALEEAIANKENGDNASFRSGRFQLHTIVAASESTSYIGWNLGSNSGFVGSMVIDFMFSSWDTREKPLWRTSRLFHENS